MIDPEMHFSIGKAAGPPDNPLHTRADRLRLLFPLLFTLLLAFVFCYYPTFLWLNQRYLGVNSYYSHGYLIPLVSAYLIYLKREKIRQIECESNCGGLVTIVFALLLHILGTLGSINFISGFSIVFYLFGTSLYLCGGNVTRLVAFPLFFLVFMCPIPDVLIDVIAIPLKSMATSFALLIMDLLDIPYLRQGFRIQFAASAFVIGTPCNGMRSLISFLALGLLLVFFLRTAFWKKALFLAIIPPVSIVLNGLRIAILLGIANMYGQDAAAPDSYLHDSSGLFVFAIGILLLMFLYHVTSERRAGS